ncbi:MAG: hypothetical protein NUV82_02725 [Candidatus Komeilibacteria bacterium]|nr:hypothetical protein [Candidatus Komeilibacteria bacterium]
MNIKTFFLALSLTMLISVTGHPQSGSDIGNYHGGLELGLSTRIVENTYYDARIKYHWLTYGFPYVWFHGLTTFKETHQIGGGMIIQFTEITGVGAGIALRGYGRKTSEHRGMLIVETAGNDLNGRVIFTFGQGKPWLHAEGGLPLKHVLLGWTYDTDIGYGPTIGMFIGNVNLFGKISLLINNKREESFFFSFGFNL